MKMGKSLNNLPGELVCASPHPTIPLYFMNDEDGQKFETAYFSKFEGVWHHGDWVQLTNEGGMIFHGRSDATLNPGGVRIGTSEIYRPVEQLGEIAESLVIARDIGGDVELVLFVRLQEGISLDDQLVTTIKNQIRNNASPRHVPRKVISGFRPTPNKIGEIGGNCGEGCNSWQGGEKHGGHCQSRSIDAIQGHERTCLIN